MRMHFNIHITNVFKLKRQESLKRFKTRSEQDINVTNFKKL